MTGPSMSEQLGWPRDLADQAKWMRDAGAEPTTDMLYEEMKRAILGRWLCGYVVGWAGPCIEDWGHGGAHVTASGHCTQGSRPWKEPAQKDDDSGGDAE